jgi:hypothetical protein
MGKHARHELVNFSTEDCGAWLHSPGPGGSKILSVITVKARQFQVTVLA